MKKILFLILICIPFVSGCVSEEATMRHCDPSEIPFFDKSIDISSLEFEEYGKEYDAAYGAYNYNGSLSYVARINHEFSIVIENDSYVYDPDVKLKKTCKTQPCHYVITKETDNDSRDIEYNGREISIFHKENLHDVIKYGDCYFYGDVAVNYTHYTIHNIVMVNGNLAYDVSTNFQRRIIYDGHEIGTEFQSAIKPKDINGKLAFGVFDWKKNYILMEK